METNRISIIENISSCITSTSTVHDIGLLSAGNRMFRTRYRNGIAVYTVRKLSGGGGVRDGVNNLNGFRFGLIDRNSIRNNNYI